MKVEPFRKIVGIHRKDACFFKGCDRSITVYYSRQLFAEIAITVPETTVLEITDVAPIVIVGFIREEISDYSDFVL